MPGEAPAEIQPFRRSGRRAKRTDRLEEFLLAAKRGFRRSWPAFPSSAWEAGWASPHGGGPVKDEGSTEKKNEEESGGGEASKTPRSKDQDRDLNEEGKARPQQKQESPKKSVKKEEKNGNEVGAKRETQSSKVQVDSEDEMSSSTTNSSSYGDADDDDGGYDDNALYCICRQKHNKRFMICCDRCEAWFHGDCVGITEAGGRLMERNGEDYVCPNCSVERSQATGTAAPDTDNDNGRPNAAAMVPGAQKAESSLSVGQATSPETSKAESKLPLSSATSPGTCKEESSLPLSPTTAPGTRKVESSLPVGSATPPGTSKVQSSLPMGPATPPGTSKVESSLPVGSATLPGTSKVESRLPMGPATLPGTSKVESRLPMGPAALPGTRKAETSLPVSPALAVPLATPSAGTEEKGADDRGIREGRIEKAVKPSRKKKIKLFQTTEAQAAVQAVWRGEAGKRAGPRCIGPGCEKKPQPDSAYCAKCFLRHAAAAMKSITDIERPRQTDRDQPGAGNKKPATWSTSEEESPALLQVKQEPVDCDLSVNVEEMPSLPQVKQEKVDCDLNLEVELNIKALPSPTDPMETAVDLNPRLRPKARPRPSKPSNPAPDAYTCEHCGKDFAKMNNLRVHMLVHTGERRYHCLLCMKSFITSNHLKRHQTVHTKEKPYTCNGCGNSFSQLCSLRRHRQLTQCLSGL